MSIISAPSVKDNILRLAQKLPAAPQIFTRLGALLNDVNADLDKIVSLISIDAGLTARVLRMSNSVYFRGGLPVQSLDEAVGRLGFREIHKVVGAIVSEQIFKDGLPVYGFNAHQTWENSVYSALATKIIAREAALDEQAAYTVGLLRQVGKVVLNRILLTEHPGILCPLDADILGWERSLLNITNHEATAHILDAWKLPQDTCLAVRYHATPEVAKTGIRLCACLHLAGCVVGSLGKGIPAEASLWSASPENLERCGLNAGFIHECAHETSAEFQILKQQLGAH